MIMSMNCKPSNAPPNIDAIKPPTSKPPSIPPSIPFLLIPCLAGVAAAGVCFCGAVL